MSRDVVLALVASVCLSIRYGSYGASGQRVAHEHAEISWEGIYWRIIGLNFSYFIRIMR
jgi:hypothetical protein